MREHVPEANFARGLAYDQFKLKEEEFETLRDYLARKNKKQPAPGQYKVEYKAVEKEVPGGYIAQAGLYDDVKLDEDQDKVLMGDVYVLNPEQPKNHIPGFDMGKIQGRTEEVKEDLDDVNYQGLILEPKNELTKPRPIVLVNMSKGADREICERGIKSSDPEYEQEQFLDLDLKYHLREPRVPNLVNYNRDQGREGLYKEVDPDRDEAIVNPNHEYVAPRVLGGVINKASEKKEKEESVEPVGVERTEQRIDLDRAYEATRPKTGVVKFQGYAARE